MLWWVPSLPVSGSPGAEGDVLSPRKALLLTSFPDTASVLDPHTGLDNNWSGVLPKEGSRLLYVYRLSQRHRNSFKGFQT